MKWLRVAGVFLKGIPMWVYVALLVGGIVAGSYFYMKNLEATVIELREENTNLQRDKQNLQANAREQQRVDNIVERVEVVVQPQREVIRERERRQNQQIDDSIRQGNDRNVGPLLRDFLNARTE